MTMVDCRPNCTSLNSSEALKTETEEPSVLELDRLGGLILFVAVGAIAVVCFASARLDSLCKRCTNRKSSSGTTPHILTSSPKEARSPTSVDRHHTSLLLSSDYLTVNWPSGDYSVCRERSAVNHYDVIQDNDVQLQWPEPVYLDVLRDNHDELQRPEPGYLDVMRGRDDELHRPEPDYLEIV